MFGARIVVEGLNDQETANKLLWLFENARTKRIKELRLIGRRYWKVQELDYNEDPS